MGAMNRMLVAALLAGTLAARPPAGAWAQDLPVFDPATGACSGPPLDVPELPGPWQTAVSADRPRVGETVTIGLGDPSGGRASELVSAILLGPDGQPLDILHGEVSGDRWAEVAHPVDRPGVHTAIWAQQYTGAYIACGGFVAEP